MSIKLSFFWYSVRTTSSGPAYFLTQIAATFSLNTNARSAALYELCIGLGRWCWSAQLRGSLANCKLILSLATLIAFVPSARSGCGRGPVSGALIWGYSPNTKANETSLSEPTTLFFCLNWHSQKYLFNYVWVSHTDFPESVVVGLVVSFAETK